MASKRADKIRIVAISDTHNAHSSVSLPKGDILIHAGDLTNQGSFKELQKAVDWISKADFAVKIVIAGNHELSLDTKYVSQHKGASNEAATVGATTACRELVQSNPNIVYLEHQSTVLQVPVAGMNKEVVLRVFGSPCSPGEGAFQYSDDAGETIWDAVPDDTDILITHVPPQGHCDASRYWERGGCSSLSTALSRIRPLLHVCGHCHEGRGAEVVDWDSNLPGGSIVRTWQDPGAGINKKQSILDLTGKTDGGALQRGRTAVVNASIMANSRGGAKGFNKPIVIDLPLDQSQQRIIDGRNVGSERERQHRPNRIE